MADESPEDKQAIRIAKIRLNILVGEMARTGADPRVISSFIAACDTRTVALKGHHGWSPFGTENLSMSNLFGFSSWRADWSKIVGPASERFGSALAEERRDVLSPLYGMK